MMELFEEIGNQLDIPKFQSTEQNIIMTYDDYCFLEFSFLLICRIFKIINCFHPAAHKQKDAAV